MNDTFLFIWGMVAFLFAVGPLIVAGFLDLRARQYVREIEEAAGLRQNDSRE